MDTPLRINAQRVFTRRGDLPGGAPHVAMAYFLPPSQRSAHLGQLIIMVEPNHLSAGEESERLATLLATEYYRYPNQSQSLTARLERSLRKLNQALYEDNLRTPFASRLYAGVSALAIRENEAYLAQVEPSLVFAVEDRVLRRVPFQPLWLVDGQRRKGPESKYLTALGRERNVTTELTRFELEPGDALVLCTSGVANLMVAQTLEAMVSQNGALGAFDELCQKAPGEGEACAVVEVSAEREGAGVAPKRVTPVPSAPEEGVGWGVRADTLVRQAEQEEDAPVALRRSPSRLAARRFTKPLVAVLRYPQQVFQPVFKPAPKRSLFEGSRPKAVTETRNQHPRLLIGMGALVAVAVMALVAVMLVSRQTEQRRAELAGLIGESQAAISAAATASTRKDANDQITLAEGRATRALELDGNSEAAKTVLAQAAQERDRVNMVQRVSNPVVLHDLSTVNEALVGKLWVDGINLYVLDSGQGRLFKLLLDDSRRKLQPQQPNPIVYRAGDKIDGTEVDGAVEMAMAPAGGARTYSALLTLLPKGDLIEFDPTRGLKVLKLAVVEKLTSPVAMAGFEGNLYVLDRKRDEVFKFAPTKDGYGSTPRPYTRPEGAPALNGIDLAVDGSVYVLSGDGSVLKVDDGKFVPLGSPELDKPIADPRSIFTYPGTNGIYVVDGKNERVVQLSKDGLFVRQLLPPAGENAFQGISRAVVDEGRGLMFFVAGKKVYVCDIAPAPELKPTPSPSVAPSASPSSPVVPAVPTSPQIPIVGR